MRATVDISVEDKDNQASVSRIVKVFEKDMPRALRTAASVAVEAALAASAPLHAEWPADQPDVFWCVWPTKDGPLLVEVPFSVELTGDLERLAPELSRMVAGAVRDAIARQGEEA